MKNVTFRADEKLIEQARQVARSRHKTLNAVLQEWLEQYASDVGTAQEFATLMEHLEHVRPGRGFTREEMNEP